MTIEKEILRYLLPVGDVFEARCGKTARHGEIAWHVRAQRIDVGRWGGKFNEALDLLVRDGLVAKVEVGHQESPLTREIVPVWGYEITEQGVIALREESER